ncbi:hypothetical protein AB1E18_013854 [Capra hircus]
MSRFMWSDVSDPLPIVVTGVFPKPSISAHPGPLVHEGENVTFRCHSSTLLDKFILHKTSSTGHFQSCGETLTGGHAPADFVIGSMTLASVGSYRCYGSLSHSPYEWSAPSDPVDIIITGRSRKPSLSAQGGPVVTSGENMTLVCSSESAFDQFHLLKEGENLGRPLAEVRGPRGALQAEFPLGPGTPAHSGVYRCYGSFTHSPYSWSDSSDPLFLSVTARFRKPSLSAQGGPVVRSGENVTLVCSSESVFDQFHLLREEEDLGPLLAGGRGPHGALQAEFLLGPGTQAHSRVYRCYGSFTRSPYLWSDSSDPLFLSVTGENVTLRCHSLLWFDEFILHQENSPGHFQRHGQILTGGHVPADFFIGPMTSVNVGTYRCYGSLRHSPYVWSAPSDPVDIIITGRSRKPSLSAQGGPLVRSEENVTLVCSSESAFDQFHLLKETEDLGQLLSVGWGPRGALQAEFPLGPGTPAHSGVYRCYGSFTRSPYSWSDPSDPLFLSVTGRLLFTPSGFSPLRSTTSTYPSPMVPHTREEAPSPQEHSSTWYIVLGLSIAFTSTSIILTALVCHWCSTPNHVANMQGEPMEDRTVNGEDSEAEDVIYANLDLGTLSKRRSTPAPLRPMHPSAETIIYEEFNINQDHAEPRPGPML